MLKAFPSRPINLSLAGLTCLILSGCASLTTENLGLDAYEIPQGAFAAAPDPTATYPAPQAPPAELAKVSLPDYTIEPPDILQIEGVRIIPKSPAEISPQDIVQIVVLGTQPERPIAGQYLVEPSGVVNLGPGYGVVRIAGLSSDEAGDAIQGQLLGELNRADVAVSIVQSAGQQVITGEHLVTPDGTVNLGLYGRVYVAGMTLDQARSAIEQQLSDYFEDPKIVLDVFVYNSKFYYIIAAGAGGGDQVVRVPITGNETVLDAISQVGGLAQSSSTKIWISRPVPAGTGCDQILPVHWEAITRSGETATNYQLLPGDRLYVAENRLLAWSVLSSALLNPFERVIGFTLLGAQTIQTMQRFPEGFRQF